MRDPERIDAILAAVGDLWRVFPDWRLGQLIVNVTCSDPFYVEDDVLMAGIEDAFCAIDDEHLPEHRRSDD